MLTSIVPLFPELIVKLRSVLTVAPVYCRAPPLKTRFAAALVEAPMPLLAPPLASVETDNVPLVTVVLPR